MVVNRQVETWYMYKANNKDLTARCACLQHVSSQALVRITREFTDNSYDAFLTTGNCGICHTNPMWVTRMIMCVQFNRLLRVFICQVKMINLAA